MNSNKEPSLPNVAEPENNNNLLVDLDSLFDTRLPVLMGISEAAAYNVLNSGYYYNRVKDEFDLIPASIFRTIYRYRTKGVLEYALPTHIFNVMASILDDIYRDDTKNVLNKDDKYLYINLYPYELSVNEKDILSKAIKQLIPPVNIKFINVNNVELTPKWIYNNVSSMIKYDLQDWIEWHVSDLSLLEQPILDVLCIGPTRLDDMMSKNTFKKEEVEQVNKVFALVADYQPISYKYFSLIKPQEKTYQDEIKET